MILYSCYRNVRSNTGANVRNIELAVKDKIIVENMGKSVHKVVEKLHFEEIPKEETWRIAVMKETVLMKLGYLEIAGFTVEEAELMLRFICST